MVNLSNISVWKQRYGLLPIHLHPASTDKNSYILLNGGYGDFCLKTEPEENLPDVFYSYAWSCNTKNFVVLNRDSVTVFNWKKGLPESIPADKVTDHFDKFYQYLIKNNYKTENDVVPFMLDIFRQFRNLTQEKKQALEALNLLLVLLAGLEDDVFSLNFEKWGLSTIAIPSNFHIYTERLKAGFLNLKPELDLILRHAAGILFQEAQKEALFFDNQLDLWGAPSSRINLKNSRYSSIHYTPPYLARTIVEGVIRQLDFKKPVLKIFDPACGSSEFLIETLKQLYELDYAGRIEITGWDASLSAINISNFLLHYEKRTIWQDRLHFQIKPVADSLLEEWDNDNDMIFMNPPFVSWEQMDRHSREAVKLVFGSKFSGRPNQASAFFFKAIQALNFDGKIGCVIPTSFFTLDAYQKTRKEIFDLISIDFIAKLGNFIFEEALTDVSIIIGHKPRQGTIPYLLWTRNEQGIAQNSLRDLRKMHYSKTFKVVEPDYSIYQPASFPIIHENWKPISFQENDLIKNLERFVFEGKLARIKDIFNVQQGIRTGNNQVFKITETEFLQLPENEQSFFRPVVDNESVNAGKIVKKNYVWYPYDEDGLLIQSEAELETRVPWFYTKQLVKYKDRLSKREGKVEKKWWQLSRYRAWLRKIEPRIVSTEFGKSDSFAFDKDGIFVVERGNAWLPKKKFKQIDDFYFYLAILSSPFFDTLLSIYSRQLAGGSWYDLGKKFTGEIPIPDILYLEGRNSQAYTNLAEIGRELSEGSFQLRTILEDILTKFFYPNT